MESLRRSEPLPLKSPRLNQLPGGHGGFLNPQTFIAGSDLWPHNAAVCGVNNPKSQWDKGREKYKNAAGKPPHSCKKKCKKHLCSLGVTRGEMQENSTDSRWAHGYFCPPAWLQTQGWFKCRGAGWNTLKQCINSKKKNLKCEMVSNKRGCAFAYGGNQKKRGVRKEPGFISQFYHVQGRNCLNPEY